MVRFEEKKIIIEIETISPFEELQTIQRALVETISILNHSHTETIENNLYYVCMLINELNMDSEGLKSLFATKEGRDLIKENINHTFLSAIANDEAESIKVMGYALKPSVELPEMIKGRVNRSVQFQKAALCFDRELKTA